MSNQIPVETLREDLTVALQKEKFDVALATYLLLEDAEPDEARWPQRKGDLFLRLKKPQDAIKAYERAVDLYAKEGFVARAAAMAKVILGLDPSRKDVLARVDGTAAMDLRKAETERIAPLPRSAAGTLGAVSASGNVRAPLPPPPPPLGGARAAGVMPPAPQPLAPPKRVGPPPRQEGYSSQPALLRETLEGIELDIDVAAPEDGDDDAPRARLSLVHDSPMLSPAHDATTDEVRFDDADDDEEAIIFDLDDGAPASVSDAERPAAKKLALTPSVPLLAGVPPEALQRMLTAAELVQLTAGETLVRAGEPSDALYVLAEGHAEVRVPGAPLEPVPLGEGEILGETCLFPGVTRRADVIAKSNLTVLRIGSDALREIVAEHTKVGDVLYELLSKRLVSNLLKTSELFAAFDPGTRNELAKLFEVRRAPAGTALFVIGKRSDGMYVPLLGLLEATLPDGRVRAVPAGRMLGEQTLFTRAPSTVGVVTASEVLLMRLSASRFNELATMYPAVLAHLSDLAGRATLEESIERLAVTD